jgi:hypothetical protein
MPERSEGGEDISGSRAAHVLAGRFAATPPIAPTHDGRGVGRASVQGRTST